MLPGFLAYTDTWAREVLADLCCSRWHLTSSVFHIGSAPTEHLQDFTLAKRCQGLLLLATHKLFSCQMGLDRNGPRIRAEDNFTFLGRHGYFLQMYRVTRVQGLLMLLQLPLTEKPRMTTRET